MPTKVTVNSGLITINDGSSFLVTASDGSIDENLPQGFFVWDTRLISYYEISLNRYRLSLLASSNITHHNALSQFTNPQLPIINGSLPAGSLLVTVRRDIVEGMHEDIDIINYHSEAVKFQLMLAVRSDFADIFEVKSQQILTRGETQTKWENGVLTTEYRNGSFLRGIVIEPVCTSSEPRYANGRLMFDVVIAPGKTWHTCVNFTALADGNVFKPQNTCAVPHNTKAGKVRDEFLTNATKLRSSNAEIAEYYQQAIADMGALRIEVDDNGHKFWMSAAGIPWFVAVFGRDSIISSLQAIAVYHEFARGTLLKLAQLQATELDDWHDVYDAWLRAALIYEVWGEKEQAKKLRQKAEELYQRFNDRFWMESVGFYCLGLDDKKQQIQSITSNPGHLLWSGIVPEERAKKLVNRLFQPDMWCGWGVRTLSSQNLAYNPISYQRGSVWPHDNSIIAAGLKRYGYHQEANRIAEGIFAAASYFQAGRMPELFAGIERQDDNFPVPYPDANIPQAWAAGSIFLLIRTILGLKADASKQQLKVQPSLPDCLPDLELTNLSVGDATVGLRFWRDGEQTQWEVTHLDGELEVYTT
ncbi:MAG: amylo-alpha-1,6-glucosidase [Nostoc sp.]